MGLKWLITTMFSVLFHPEAFWHDREARHEVNAMRDYAAPLIAVVQFFKMPQVGVPRLAMIMAVVSFIIDVAVLYVLAGGIAALAGRHRRAEVQEGVLTMLCYVLTPLWLVEPFSFIAAWRWGFLALALLHAFVGLKAALPETFGAAMTAESLTWKADLMLAVAALASFVAMTGLMRIFTSL